MPADDSLNIPNLPVPVPREIRKARRQLAQLANDITLVAETGAAELPSSEDVPVEFFGMIEVLDRTYAKYMEVYDDSIELALDLKVDFPQRDDEDRLREVKSCYFQAHGHKVRLSRSSTTANQNNSSSTSGTFHQQPSKRTLLPKIQIKTFSGDFSEWATFHQLFIALVIEDRNLSDAERFHYLVSLLDGIALDAIKHIQVHESNFTQAYDALKRVFDDKRKLANTYLNNMLNFKPMSGRPTVDSLQQFLSQVSESVISLQNLKIPKLDEYLLSELALKSLDPITREAFELQWVQVGSTFPDFATLKQFVENRVSVLRLTKHSTPKLEVPTYIAKPFKPPNKYIKGGQALLAHTSPKGSKRSVPTNDFARKSNMKFECFVCKGPHRISDCSRFEKMDPIERLDALKTYSGCRNCLHPSHKTSSCTSEFSCKFCNKKHNSALHLFLSSETSSPKSAISTTTGSQQPADAEKFCGSSTSLKSSGVLLGTVVCQIKDGDGNFRSYRGVLDPGSQFSFLKAQTCKELKLSSRPHEGMISGVNQARLKNLQGKVDLCIKPPPGYHSLETEAIVVPSITPPLPQVKLESGMWCDFKSYPLSDPNFTEPGPIHFLIGADLYPEIVTSVPIAINEKGPRLINTLFGFAVIGRYSSESLIKKDNISLLSLPDPTFQLEKFWEIEEPSIKSAISPSDEACERHFQETYYRTPSGRYVVSLPFTTPNPDLEPNIPGALNRLFSLEAKFAKNDDLRIEYHKFLKEYEELGHMQLATTPPKFVIPHHPVFKVNGDKKSIRVVFDGGYCVKSKSLNDSLHVGPKLQNDISDILLNMRRFRYAVTCDIVKCFRQIEINPQDRCYQQIVWRYNSTDPVSFYELKTVTYGTRSAPWLCNRVIRALVDDEGVDYPNASNSLRHSIYVDDIIDGRDSIEELLQLKNELEALLKRGEFTLSKWSSNYLPIVNNSQSNDPVSLCEDENPTTKILGMHWNPKTDVFSYVVNPTTEGFTKRIILSIIARLYDPLGYLAPVIFYAKCLMQETWKYNLNWDEEVPDYLKGKWKGFTNELPALSHINIPRALPKTDTTYQLMCFSDASEKGYCAAAYIRATQQSGVTVTLLKAKTRLAPVKSETIPRLELCGALLLSELLKSMVPFRKNLNITEIYCFTDSTTVLAWLKTPPHLLQIYVARRVQKILELTNLEWWHHVKGLDNPADVGSRGSTPASLRKHPLWWEGPSWSHDHVENWPISGDIHIIDIPELKPSKLSLISIEESPDFLKYVLRHSSWIRLVRVVAWIKRFSTNSKLSKIKTAQSTKGPLTPTEIRESNFNIIRILQRAYYPEIYVNLSFNKLPLELRRHNVFVDSYGVVRVGGRLANTPLQEDQKHPILLPARNHFTTILVRHLHKQNNHVGPSTLLALIRQQYWISNGRNLVKKITHKCIVCTRYSRNRIVPFMGNLPSSRFYAVRPFLVCGVDFAGYFLCKESVRKNARTFKCYLSIFVCMSTRAYHLELVTGLSVEAFLDAFTRFTARRGVPSQMMSDQGTNFVGTVNYLKEVQDWLIKIENQSAIINSTSHLGVEWRFNPPATPHFGGSWETGVKAVKTLLHKTFHHLTYTQEELTTIFTKIEGVLNSRPLQPLSTSPCDPDALTPAHFLIGQTITAPAEIDFTDVPANRLNRWQLIQERIQHFWKRWRIEYVSSLQTREKWNKKSTNIKIGDIVILSDVNTSPMHWPLARVIQVHPGEDEIVRVVTLKTNRGIFKRPSVKVIPLPIRDCVVNDTK